MKINPQTSPHQQFHQLLLGSIAPRPIAFASTVDIEGNPNLSPFSFFNAFGVNPTTLIFSPSRRGRDNTTKHTFDNLKAVPEVVINVVTFSMVQQTSLASTEYAKGVNEFIKAGFTPIEAEMVRPFRVKESPVQFECKVRQIIETGDGPGAGNLVICEILLMHIDDTVVDDDNMINPDKIDLVGRIGGDYYVRTSGAAKFMVPKPLRTLGIGIDSLPDKIKLSPYLTGNELGMLGNQEVIPSQDEIISFRESHPMASSLKHNPDKSIQMARQALAKGEVAEALMLLMAFY
jgi:flavin reductase (DIM6/NTAB) family NADH-FMN oxidoreductase RutF